MELSNLYQYVINVSGQFLLGSTLELTQDIFMFIVKNSLRDLNKYQPYSVLHTSMTAGSTGRCTFVETFLDKVPEAVVGVIPVSGAYPFYPYQYIKDPWQFDMNRIYLPIRYEKPNLYAPLAGVYNAETIHYHWLRQQSPISGLTGTGIEIELEESSYFSEQLAIKLSEIFVDDANFDISILGNTITFTSKANGETFTPPLVGNTGWVMNIISLGDIATPMSVSFTLSDVSDYSLTGKYFILASPTTKYYYWFDLNHTAVDPAVGGYFLDKINELSNPHFFDLCAGRFKKALGSSRKSFVLSNMPITNDGDALYSEGSEQEKEALEMLKANSFGYYSWR
jgi:hypothetical protein